MSLQRSFLTVGICLLVLLRLLCTRNRPIITAGFLCSFFVLFFSINTRLQERAEQKAILGDTVSVLFVQPDKINLRGDLLQIDGTLIKDEKKLAIRASYYLSNEKEQKFWLRMDKKLKLHLSGTLESPASATNLNGFDYQKMLRYRGINQVFTIKEIQRITVEKPPFYHIFAYLTIVRKKALLYCEKEFPETAANYLKLLLFGEKSAQSEQSEQLQSIGILHLFSLSGMHVSFYTKVFKSAALRTGLTIESFFWLQLLVSFFYAGLAGFSISVSRALIQKNLMEGNQRYQLHLSALDIWSITLLLGVLFDPFLLFTLAGQFSYFLSFGILFTTEALKKSNKGNYLIKQLLFSGLLSLYTLPILGLSVYEWQPIGVLLSFLLMPVFEWLLLPILTAVFIASTIYQPPIVSQALEAALVHLNRFFEWVGTHNIFTVVIGSIPLWLFFIEIGLIMTLLYYLGKKFSYALLAAGLLLLLLNQKYFFQNGIVAFIDVGQGDSIFIQKPLAGESILIDTGGRLAFPKEPWQLRHQKSNAAYTVVPFLKSRGVKKLDKVIITHSDTDHMGDLLEINHAIPIHAVYFGAGAEQKKSFQAVLRALRSKGTRCYPLLAGETVLQSSFDLKVLAPIEVGKGSNDDSVVIQMQIKGRRLLFTGDLEEAGEQQLITNFPTLKTDLLKVGHHGSRTSTSSKFLELIAPTDAVISCGRENRFGHPHEEILSRLKENNIQIYRTDQQGMVYYTWHLFTALSKGNTVLDSD
ncbi:DNA internalization-related competence protein ComEC/Rec2 [Enterococcus sp. LJL51]|uniref:DNA internalization-related competence protein ComEC/Rec2 n=1 Tax=Enterococcus sp. LJL51 TaxID=3416656 RepID=UPI003CE72D02